MSEGGAHKISTRIKEKLAGLSETSCNQFLFRIDRGLRRTNEMAYEPEILSIGPYHHGKNNLQKMEKYKLQYLKGVLKRQNDESSAEKYIKALMQDEIKARNYYADNVSLSGEDFVEMMLLDGCFIIELLRKRNKKQELENDPIFKMSWILIVLRRDLLLFENQVPFFILDKLFEMTKIPNEEQGLIPLAISFLNTTNEVRPIRSPVAEDVSHLLSLMHKVQCSSFASEIRNDYSRLDLQDGGASQTDIFIKSVTELKQHGIEFVELENSTWLDIRFEDRKMKIPHLDIHDGTESTLRNLIAYEQYMFDAEKFVTDYIALMDCLINTAEDVKMLRDEKIIVSWLGNDEEIAKMFKDIGKNVELCPPFSYQKLFKKVNEHCNEPFNSWIADLKSTYFKNPWSIISFVAAIFLLVLTVIQTIFSIL